MGLPQADPAAGADAPGLRGGPSRLRRLKYPSRRYDHATAAEDLHHLARFLGVGPVHFLCQDASGGPGFRFAAAHPDEVLSFTAVESALAGFGLESFADVAHGGSWHVGFLAAPGIPTMLLPGRERELLAGWATP